MYTSSMRVTKVLQQGYRRLKNITPQSWIQVSPSTSKPFIAQNIPDLVIKDYRDIKLTYKRGLEGEPVPVSPVLGPIRVQNPKVATKKYRWCACGMSAKQPFCDDSHDGTLFLPLKFTFEQRTDFAELCGCKHSKDKPFCDGQSCKELQALQDQRLQKQSTP